MVRDLLGIATFIMLVLSGCALGQEFDTLVCIIFIWSLFLFIDIVTRDI